MTYFLADTKKNIYWDEYLEPYKPKSDIGLEIWKSMKPYTHVEEDLWREEVENIGTWVSIIKNDRLLFDEIENLYNNFYDIRNLLDSIMVKKLDEPLIDGFHLKQFLWFSYSLSAKINQAFPTFNGMNTKTQRLIQHEWEKWLLNFQPNYSGVFYPNFALQDIDDRRLKLLREEKRKKTIEARKYEQERKKLIEAKYKVKVNHDRYLIASKTSDIIDQLSNDGDLEFIRYQGESLVFFLNSSSEEKIIHTELGRLNQILESEEKRRFSDLIANIDQYVPIWHEALIEWGKLEVILKKAKMAVAIDGTKPELAKNSRPVIHIQDGYHPYLAKLWEKDMSDITKFSLSMENGVAVLYGANMSGKTIILRAIGLIQALAQHGFYVPAAKLQFSFISHITLMTGDYQSVNNGLSTFGSEISRLSQDLTNKNKILYLLDEIGTGTNPLEGEALAIAILRYLKTKNGSLSFLVSHFPNLIQEDGIKLYETKNFQLIKIDKASMVYEGISIAESLGLPSSIVNQARKYLDELK